ncbi:MAG TPA: DUF2934 domain-containing protein [Burkholderiales bacterium]|nr:DUF2934 domain-containing protein [Burkholderiales bacterium]
MATPQSGKSRTTRKTLPDTTKARARSAPAPAAKISKAKKSAPAVAADAWREMVATAAYYRAQARSFQHGSPEQDWLAAEAELKRRLGKIAKT